MSAHTFQQQLNHFPQDVATILQTLPAQNGRLDAQQMLDIAKLLNVSVDDALVKLLPIAATLSTPPISEFYVGAIVEGYRDGEQGPLYFGANQEFVGQPLKMSIHAEQAAISNAWHQGETRLRRLIVNDAPCGHCRQFINELNGVEAMTLTIDFPKTGVQCFNISELLPNAFGPDSLGQSERLLQTYHCELPHPSHEDPLVSAAHSAAQASYAPYSGGYCGVALKLESGEIISGRYAENCAYNPSLTAMEAALFNLRLHGLSVERFTVVDAVMVENSSKVSHQQMAQSLLEPYGVELRYFAVK